MCLFKSGLMDCDLEDSVLSYFKQFKINIFLLGTIQIDGNYEEKEDKG